MTTTITSLAKELRIDPKQVEEYISRLLKRTSAEQGILITFTDIEDPGTNLDLDEDDMAIDDKWVPHIRDEAIGLNRIRDARQAVEDAEEYLTRTVIKAREAGASWADLAAPLGVDTRAGARSWFMRRASQAYDYVTGEISEGATRTARVDGRLIDLDTMPRHLLEALVRPAVQAGDEDLLETLREMGVEA